MVTKEGIAGVGALSPHCICDLRDDPLFLCAQGVCGLEASPITTTRYAQMRSELVNKKLCAEPGLAGAVMVEYDGYMLLAVNGSVYVADGAQRSYRGRSADTYQYEWYYWQNVPARMWFKHAGWLWFGTADGKIMRFQTGDGAYEGAVDKLPAEPVYSDDGQPIRARWTTPEIAFDSYSLFKTLRRIYTKVTPYSRTSVRVYMKVGGGFVEVDYKTADIFDFTFKDIDFTRFTFNTDRDVGVIATKVKAKRLITTQIRLVNNEDKEPFGVTGLTLYYDLKNKVK